MSNPVPPDFPIGGGRMGERIRDLDWNATALGPTDTWSPALRSVVQMMVAQKQAICLFWGPDLALIYNELLRGSARPRNRQRLASPSSWSGRMCGMM